MPAMPKAVPRHIGASGLGVAPIGLGCMSLSGAYGASDDAQAIRLVHHAIDRGITHLDSSDMYGWGHNETLLGRALAGRRDKVMLATKFGQVRREGGANGVDGSPQHGRAACEASLQRLGVETITSSRAPFNSRSARPSSVSLWPQPYMSAESRKLMPRCSA